MHELPSEESLEMDRFKERLLESCLESLAKAPLLPHSDGVPEWVRRTMYNKFRQTCEQYGMDFPLYADLTEVKDETQS